MRVQTQFGLTNINPVDVVSIKPVSLCIDYAGSDELTHCVEYKDRSSAYARSSVCVTERAAKELSRVSGVEMPKKEVNSMQSKDTIFVPFGELFALNSWEKFFDGCEENAVKTAQEKESAKKPTPSSSLSNGRTLYEENHQPISLIEQVFRSQNNCIQCGRLVFDESRVCSECIGKSVITEN